MATDDRFKTEVDKLLSAASAQVTQLDSTRFQVARCSVCRKKFYNSGNLLRHMRSQHTDAEDIPPIKRRKGMASSNSFQCPCCEKRFSTGSNLLKHAKKSHVGIKMKRTKARQFSNKLRKDYETVASDNANLTAAKARPWG